MSKGSTFQRGVKDSSNPYLMIRKEPLNDESLSWKAKGILTYLLSLPDDWKIYEVDLVERSKDGRDSLRSGIKELIDAGYIERHQSRTTGGQFKGYDYIVWEVLDDRGVHRVGKSDNGKSYNGKSNTTNNNTTNKQVNNSIYSPNDPFTKIFNAWIKADIVKHQRLTKAMERKIKSALKDYTVDEIVQAVSNYGHIVNDDRYFFNYKWTLDQFCTISQKDRIATFLDLETAKANYMTDKARNNSSKSNNQGIEVKEIKQDSAMELRRQAQALWGDNEC